MNNKFMKIIHALTIIVGSFFLTFSALAGPLNIADNALEKQSGALPNVVILTDDSGSMDFEILSKDFSENLRWTGKQPDGSNAGFGSVIHRDADEDGDSDCDFDDGDFDGYIYGVEFTTNTYSDNSDDCNTVDEQAWRFRNSDFNPLYFNPNRVYQPWIGVDINGISFTDIDVTNAPDDPYNPINRINLTINNSNSLGVNNHGTSDRDNDGEPDGFRYYTWQDLDNDGLFDNGEETEYLIKNQDAATQRNFANWFSYHRSREHVARAAISEVISSVTNARVGYATINTANNNFELASMNPLPSVGNKKLLLDKVYGTPIPLAGTPLRQNLREVGQYFECVGNNKFGNSCALLPAPLGACQQNYVILMTDGFYNGDSPSIGNTDSNGPMPFDGGAYADTYSNTLADVAMHFYERDLSGFANDVPTTANDRNGSASLANAELMHQHMKTYTVSFGVNGNLTSNPPNITDAFSWPDPFNGTQLQQRKARIDDLRHASYNGRGEYLSAENPVELVEALKEIFAQIAAGVGASSAVAFNTQNIESGSKLFRAFFDSKNNTGDMTAHQINQNGSINAFPEWSAAEQLDSMIFSNRVVVTYKDEGVASAGLPFRFNNLTAVQKLALNTPQPANVGSVGEARVNYLRGDSTNEGASFDDGEFRERPMTKGKLGDFIHAAPVFVGEPPFGGRDSSPYPIDDADLYSKFRKDNQNRQEVVYIGGNDGMLHGFSASDGKEVIAYVPNLVMPNLSELTKPDYQHRMYVDLSPSINDAYLNGQWKTLLMGGLGAGGKGYYALDITDPSAFSSEGAAKNTVLWEFAETDDGGVGNSDLGYSFSTPQLVMTNTVSNGQQRWAAIFGNGYNSTSADGDSVLYILFIEAGSDGVWGLGDFIKISTGKGLAESSDGTTPNALATPRVIDADSNGTADYVYAGDYQGNMYRFDLTSSNANQWGNPKIIYSAMNPNNQVQPITTQPIVVSHPENQGFIVMFGTGSWVTVDDATNMDIQSIYGIWDDLSNNPLVDQGDLVEQVFTNEIPKVADFRVRTLTNNSINWNPNKDEGWYIDLDVPPAGANSGVEFPGERAIRKLRLRGGILFANTVLPRDPTTCAPSPGGFSLAINPYTGSRPDDVVFDLNNDSKFDNVDNVNSDPAPENIVAGTRFDGAVPTDPAFIENILVTQLSDNTIQSINTNTGNADNTGRLSWRELTFE